MEEYYQEEYPYGEVGRQGACHKRNSGQVGLQVWPDGDTVSIPYDKGKSALKVLMDTYIDSLHDVLGELDISQGQLNTTLQAFCFSLSTVKRIRIPRIPLGIDLIRRCNEIAIQ